MPVSNGVSHLEEEEDEDEQGEKFEFEDSDDNEPAGMSSGSLTKNDWAPHTVVSNSVQEMVKQGANGTISTGHKDQNTSQNYQDCSGKCSILTTI